MENIIQKIENYYEENDQIYDIDVLINQIISDEEFVNTKTLTSIVDTFEQRQKMIVEQKNNEIESFILKDK